VSFSIILLSNFDIISYAKLLSNARNLLMVKTVDDGLEIWEWFRNSYNHLGVDGYNC
jgi:hypothetical protein